MRWRGCERGRKADGSLTSGEGWGCQEPCWWASHPPRCACASAPGECSPRPRRSRSTPAPAAYHSPCIRQHHQFTVAAKSASSVALPHLRTLTAKQGTRRQNLDPWCMPGTPGRRGSMLYGRAETMTMVSLHLREAERLHLRRHTSVPQVPEAPYRTDQASQGGALTGGGAAAGRAPCGAACGGR